MDTKERILDALETGKDIEFHYGTYNYFITRNSDGGYLYCCIETKFPQQYASKASLLEKAMVGNVKIESVMNELEIDYIG
ncbi:hypothetical protein [Chakrabartyella piscis]|uniref:hypothetical protein n=1 Tax=Chakrabartyella piscis TaxID=2918914 RepID=UPI002958CBAA|nr:hypothetical protein [Chakrabartyella piscis]